MSASVRTKRKIVAFIEPAESLKAANLAYRIHHELSTFTGIDEYNELPGIKALLKQLNNQFRLLKSKTHRGVILTNDHKTEYVELIP